MPVAPGKPDIHWQVSDEGVGECPRSLITRTDSGRRAEALVQILTNAERIKEESGYYPLGDVSEMPGRLVDAIGVVAVAKSKITSQFRKAEAIYIKQMQDQR